MKIPLFNKNSEPLLGIDIGSTSLKIVELSRSGRTITVQNAGVFPLPANTIVEGKIADIPTLAQTLRKAVALMKTKAKHVALAVPGSAVITRVLDMPSDLSEDELETQLLMEAEQYIPYSLDEVAVDFTVIEEGEEGTEQVKVLLAACRKESIDALTEMVEQADLESKIIDVEPFCLERVYPLLADQLEEDNEGLIAVVDCGATNLRINVLDRGSTTTGTNLVLVGPMGAGKTSVGKMLADRLGLRFIDSDHELETRCGADIPWIFDIEGETGFRARETEVLSELCEQSGILLATGGGAILSEKNRRILRNAGVVVYLSASADQIYKRVRHDTNRPLLQVENPRGAIADILEIRTPLYREVADIVLPSTEGESPGSMASAVCNELKKRFPKEFNL